MWQCPKCGINALNPEVLTKHQMESEKCKGVTYDLRGWQGMKLDGNPKARTGEVLWTDLPA